MANMPKKPLIPGKSNANKMGAVAGDWNNLTSQQKVAASMPAIDAAKAAVPAATGLQVKRAPVGGTATQTPFKLDTALPANPAANAAQPARVQNTGNEAAMALAGELAKRQSATVQPGNTAMATAQDVASPAPGPLMQAAGAPGNTTTFTGQNAQVGVGGNNQNVNTGTVGPVAGSLPSSDPKPAGFSLIPDNLPRVQPEIVPQIQPPVDPGPQPGTLPSPDPQPAVNPPGGNMPDAVYPEPPPPKIVPPIEAQPPKVVNPSTPGNPQDTSSWISALSSLLGQTGDQGQAYYDKQAAAAKLGVEQDMGASQSALARQMAARGFGNSGQYLTGANAVNAGAIGKMGQVEADMAKQQNADKLASLAAKSGLINQGISATQAQQGLGLQQQDLANAETSMKFNMLSNLMESGLKDEQIAQKLGLPSTYTNYDMLQWLLGGAIGDIGKQSQQGVGLDPVLYGIGK